MTDYREILRLRSLGINRSQIALSMGISRQTVVKVLQRATVQEMDWQNRRTCQKFNLPSTMTPNGHKNPHVVSHGELVMIIYDTLCPWGKG